MVPNRATHHIFIWYSFLRSSQSNSRLYQKTCSKIINSENKSLEAFIACRLILLNKNPGLRNIGVGEVLRRITTKVAMNLLKKDAMHDDGSLQVCASQEAGAEAVVRAMYDIYIDEHSEADLLVDAENAFN